MACHLCGAKPLPELMLVNPWLQVMACHLCGAKPLPELMLIYHPCQQIEEGAYDRNANDLWMGFEHCQENTRATLNTEISSAA